MAVGRHTPFPSAATDEMHHFQCVPVTEFPLLVLVARDNLTVVLNCDQPRVNPTRPQELSDGPHSVQLDRFPV